MNISKYFCFPRFKSSLGNTLGLEGNIVTVVFQYSFVRQLGMDYHKLPKAVGQFHLNLNMNLGLLLSF